MRCSNTWLSQNVVDGWGPESILLTNAIPGSYSYSVSAQCQSGIIRTALWHTSEVTNAVRDMVKARCEQGFYTLDFSGDYNILFGDPAYNVVKVMKIVFADGNEWFGAETVPVTLCIPQITLFQSSFTVTFYGATSKPLVFLPSDVFTGNSIVAFKFAVSNDGVMTVTHVSSSIKLAQDPAEHYLRLTPCAARNFLSAPFSAVCAPSRIAIYGHNSSEIPTSGSVLSTIFGHQFSASAISSSIRL
jgi:hypothetical protein